MIISNRIQAFKKISYDIYKKVVEGKKRTSEFMIKIQKRKNKLGKNKCKIITLQCIMYLYIEDRDIYIPQSFFQIEWSISYDGVSTNAFVSHWENANKETINSEYFTIDESR